MRFLIQHVDVMSGEHLVEVLYHDRPVSESPFRCQVFDSSKVCVRDLPPFTNVGTPVEFNSPYRPPCFLLT